MSALIPESTRRWLEQIPQDRPAALLLRHAARDHLPPGEAGYALPITPAGRAQAEALGALIGDRLRAVYASPLLRTMQTGVGILSGAGRAAAVQPDHLLGDPGAFVVDERAGQTWAELGHEAVMGHIVSEDEPLPGLAAPDPAARFLAHHLLRRSEEPGVTVFVTHDSLVTGLASRLLKAKFTLADWPDFLEGAFLWQGEAGVEIGYRELRASRSGPLVGASVSDLIYLQRRRAAGTSGLEALLEDSSEIVLRALREEAIPALRGPEEGRWPALRGALSGALLLAPTHDLELRDMDLPLPNEAGTWTPASLVFTGPAWGAHEAFSLDLWPEHRLRAPDELARRLEMSEDDVRESISRLGVGPAPRPRLLRLAGPVWRRFAPLSTPPAPPVPEQVWRAWQRECPVRSGENWPYGEEVTPRGVMWVTGLECPSLTAKVAAWVLAHPGDFIGSLSSEWRNRHTGQDNEHYAPWVTLLRAVDPPCVPTDPGAACRGELARPSQLLGDRLDGAPGNHLLPLVAPSIPEEMQLALKIQALEGADAQTVVKALHRVAAQPGFAAHDGAAALVRRLWLRFGDALDSEEADALLTAPVPAWRGGALVAASLSDAPLLRLDDAPSWSHLLPQPEGLLVLDMGQSSRALYALNALASALRDLLSPERVQVVSRMPLPEGWEAEGEAEELLPYLRAQLGEWFDAELEQVLAGADSAFLRERRRADLAQAKLHAVDAPGDAAIWRPESKTLYVTRGLLEAPLAVLRAAWPALDEPSREPWIRWAEAAARGGAARRAAIAELS